MDNISTFIWAYRKVNCMNSKSNFLACVMAVFFTASFGSTVNAALDLDSCWVKFPTSGIYLCSVPDGSGTTLDDEGGVIEVWLQDSSWNGIANFPKEDIALFTSKDGYGCFDGEIMYADSDTDSSGYTTFSGAWFAGGEFEIDSVFVRIKLGQLWYTLTEVISGGDSQGRCYWFHSKSPDIDGSNSVNLTDTQLFVADFQTNNLRSDLNWDGQVNLSDLPILSAAIGASCP